MLFQNLAELANKAVILLMSQPTPRQTVRIITAAFFTLVGLVLLYQVFVFLQWALWLYSMIVGALLGALVGGVFIREVSRELRAGLIGVYLGLGVDWFVSLKAEESFTVVARLAKFVSNASDTVIAAMRETGLSPIPRSFLAIGFWSFVAAFGLVLLFELLFLGKGKEDG